MTYAALDAHSALQVSCGQLSTWLLHRRDALETWLAKSSHEQAFSRNPRGWDQVPGQGRNEGSMLEDWALNLTPLATY
jgi:hypothetical protein